MNTFTSFIETKMTPIMAKVGSNRILTIIRDSMSSIMAILVIGSISVLLGNIPYEPVAEFLLPIKPLCDAISSITTGMMGLLTAGTFAYFAAQQYKTDTLSSVITSIAVFLLAQTTADGVNIAGLGSEGLVTAMIVAYVVVKLIQITKEKNVGIKMPDGVPPAVANSFQSLLPATIAFILFGVITFVFGININEIVAWLLQPIAGIINTPYGYALYHMLCGLVFFCGINSAVVIGIVAPIIMQNSALNDAAVAAGGQSTFIATNAVDTMMWSGGTGVTIGLAILMAFAAKSQYFKTLGKLSVAPAAFNINEPMIFGTPIIFNPLFLIPFVLLPGVMAFITHMLMSSGIIGMPLVSTIPWTLPPIISAFITTGGNIPATVWNVIMVVVSVAVYYPFFKVADKQELDKESI